MGVIIIADGRVEIDVILDDGRVGKGVANVDKKLGGITKTSQRAAAGIGKIVTALGLFSVGAKAVDTLTRSLDGAITRYDTLNTFPKVMQQIGFSAEESQKAIDKLSDGIQGLPTKLDDVTSTAQQIATMTGDLDGAVDTTLALNNAFLTSGASSADAARGLQQYVQMLSRGEVDMQSWRTLQETMGVALNDTAKAFGFAGESAQNDLYAALQSGEITFDEFNNKIVELSNATDGFADRAKTASGGIRTAWTNMGTAVQRGLANIIESIDEVLAGTPLKSIENVINTLGGAFEGFLNTVADGISSFGSMLNEGGVGNIVQTIATNIQENLPTLMQSGLQMIQSLMQGLVDNLPLLLETWLSLLEIQKQNIIEFLPQLIETGIQMLQSILQGMITATPFLLEGILGILIALVGVVLENLPMILESGIEILNALLDGIIQMLPQLVDTAVMLVERLMDVIIQNLPMIIDAGIELLFALIDGIIDVLPQLVSIAVDLVVRVMNAIIDNLDKIIEAGIELIFALIAGLIEAIPDLVAAIPQIVSAIFDAFGEVDWGEIGSSIIEGVWAGIKGMGKWIGGKISGFASNMLGWAKDAFDINSPSRIFRDEIGKSISEGIGVGIEDNDKLAMNPLDNLSGSLLRDMQAEIGVTNRLRGASLNMSGVAPAGVGYSPTQNNINYDRLGQVMAKYLKFDFNIDGDRVATAVNTANAVNDQVNYMG